MGLEIYRVALEKTPMPNLMKICPAGEEFTNE
jgi:hypothetical protein